MFNFFWRVFNTVAAASQRSSLCKHKADSGRIVYLRESVAAAAIMPRHN
jgi:hypothetical protein